jgi:hypothetical protein
VGAAARARIVGAAAALFGAACLASRAACAEADASGFSPAEFWSSFRGPFAGLELRSSRVGYGALGDLGARWFGTRSLAERSWLARWDLSAAARGGFLGSAVPVTPLVGVRALLDGELGYRFRPRSAWSAYAAAEGGLAFRWLAHPGIASAAANEMTGTGGLDVAGEVRAGFGASYLDDAHSLVLVAFAQEAWRKTATSASTLPFTEAGLEVRYDIARRFTANAEASWGWATLRRDTALGATDRATRVQLAVDLRRWFSERTWLGVRAAVARDGDRVTYAASQTSYTTAAAPELELGISFGRALGRR